MTSDDDLRIRSILIVGGGTAGWMAAAHLNRALGSSVRITLIESKVIGRIGVGEATVPTLRFTMKFLGLEDRDWMPHCNATYKAAVRFNDWNRPPGADGSQDYFYHPFFERNERLLKPFHGGGYFPEKGDGLSLIHAWHRRFVEGHRVPFAYACLPGAAICDNKLAPRQIASDEYAIVTAYHVDAFGVGDFLRDLAVSRGVEHIYDDVVGATLDARGYVDEVMTSSGRRLKADLFLDCTGFRGTLINGALNVPFRSESGSLLCDAAVAMPAASDPPEDGLRPYTSATARGAGWIWEIPLVTRYGTGYVYASSFLDRDAAESELRQFLGAKSHGSPANHIRMRVGRNERMWEKNCVSIGLSSCFVEPLESTTIFLIEYALANLVTFFPDRRFHPARTRKFNDAMERMFDEIRDFIILHYVLAGRDETPFWKAVHRDTVIPDTLAQQLEFLEEGLPMLDHFSNFVFRERSYTCVLDGLGKLPRHALPLIAHLDPRVGEAELEASARMTEHLLQSLPGHREYIAWLRDGKTAR